MRSRIIGLLVAAVVAVSADATDLSELLEKIEAAYGGREAVAQLETYRVEGTARNLMLNATGNLARDYQAPNRLKVVIDYPEKSEVRILDGEGAWRGGKTGVRAVEGPMRAAMEYQLLRSELPGVLLRYRNRLEDGGIVEHEDGSHHLLVLKWSDLIEMRYWVEEGTFRVTHVESTLTMNDRKAIFATAYGDYRTIEGVLFPFHETNYAGGRHVAETVVERLILNPGEMEPFGPQQPVTEPTEKPGAIEG